MQVLALFISPTCDNGWNETLVEVVVVGWLGDGLDGVKRWSEHRNHKNSNRDETQILMQRGRGKAAKFASNPQNANPEAILSHKRASKCAKAKRICEKHFLRF